MRTTINRALAIMAVLVMAAASLVTPAAAQDEAQDLPTIAEVASGDHRFTTLVSALTAASSAPGGTDFLAAVSDPNASLTVFAPTNDALWALGDTLDAALADPGGLLTDVLAYHVVAGSNDAAALVAAGSATTLGGESVTITTPSYGRVQVNDATVVIADIQTANGIIHVIDAVLIPASVSNPPADTSGAGSFDYPDTPDDFVGRSGSVAAAAAPAPAGAGEALAATGSESTVYLIAAGLLLLAGAFVILSRDRRELALVNGRLSSRSVSSYAWPSQPEHPEHHSFSDALD